MTISTTTSRQSYNGNGVTTVFSVPFRFFANSDLVVQLVTVSTGASTTLALTTHYTVTGADEEDGGSLTMLVAPAVGQRLVIRRVISATQEVDYVSGDPFPAETHERALDRLTMLAQQGEEVNARALVFPAGDTASGELPAVATRANRLLGFNDTGGLVVSAPASGSAAELALDLAASSGAGLVGFLQSGVGATPRTAESKLRDMVSVKDFDAVGDGVTDETSSIQNADAERAGKSLFFPAGEYVINSDITFSSCVIMDAGAKIITSSKLIFSNGFQSPLSYCLDASGFVQFLDVEQVYPQWFGAMGDAVFATCSVSAGSTSVTVFSPGGLSGGANGFNNGDTVFINGAGVAGGVLFATVVSGGGTGAMVISTPAVTAVSSKSIASRDDTVALRRFFASVQAGTNSSKYGTSQPSTIGTNKLYVPFGTYCSFDEITCYGNTLLEGEFAVPLGGARIIHCNIAKPLINVVADNFNATGGSTNGGNNNNIIRHIGFSGAEINDSQTNQPTIKYQHAWNTHSDCELDHVLWQGTAGACVGGGFATTGDIVAGSAALTMADGSVFRNGDFGGGRITIVGAGTAGANLNAYIVSGGGTNTVTINTPAITSVTNAVVFPQNDTCSIKVNDCEMDVCRAGFDFVGNVRGTLVINNLLAFWVIRGAIRIFSVSPVDVFITDSIFDGCGNPTNITDITWRNSIVVDSEYEGSLLIDSCIFRKSSAFGGRIAHKGDSFKLRNSRFLDIDSGYNEKFIQANSTQIVIQDNVFKSSSLTSYANARMLALPYVNTTLVKITGNTFENTNASSYEHFIQSNNPLNVCQIVGNTFKGNVTTPINSNITNEVNTIVLNQGYNPVQRYGNAAPGVSGPWGVGDITWNTAPTAGGNIGWVCTAAGTPGTWKTFGSITA